MNPLAHTAVLPHAASARVLALGAFLKNRACLLDGTQAHWSALHGDLGTPESRAALHRSVDLLLATASGSGLARPVHAVAHDLHPDFYSTHLAQELAQRLNVPLVGVQHHHAHVAVALAEQGYTEATQPVIGLALDGMGCGTDGSAWGGEVLWVHPGAPAAINNQWQRLGHLAPLAMPGGDVAAREPWRMAAAVLFALGRGAEIEPRFGSQVGSAAKTVHTMLQRGVNCPRSSSAGRWFDAAAGALGISLRQAHEAQAAMALEQMAAQWLAENSGVDLADLDAIGMARTGIESFAPSLDLHPVVAHLFTLAGQGTTAVAQGAALFHGALAAGLAHSAVQAAANKGISQVVLSGGCMANKVLAAALRAHLARAGLHVLEPKISGYGDEGLALGQAWVAACSVNMGHTPPTRHTATASLSAAASFALEN